MIRASRFATIAVAGVALWILTSCGDETAPEAEINSAWQVELDHIRSRAEHHGVEFPLQIIEDGEITPAEVQEAWDRTNECALDAGAAQAPFLTSAEHLAIGNQVDDWWEPTIMAPWPEGYDFDSVDGLVAQEEMLVRIRHCINNYNGGVVGAYYRRMFAGDPADAPQRTVDCLAERGLVPEGFTVLDLQAVQGELAFPTTLAEAQADPRFLNCRTEGAGWSCDRNPDWEFVSTAVPGAPDLDQGEARECMLIPNW